MDRATGISARFAARARDLCCQGRLLVVGPAFSMWLHRSPSGVCVFRQGLGRDERLFP